MSRWPSLLKSAIARSFAALQGSCVCRSVRRPSGPFQKIWMNELCGTAVSGLPPPRIRSRYPLPVRSADWALPELIGALDDDFLVNRQFARTGIEKLVGRSLKATGYRFYMTRDERKQPLVRIRSEWLRLSGQAGDEKVGGEE